jgi:hypothetical protein
VQDISGLATVRHCAFGYNRNIAFRGRHAPPWLCTGEKIAEGCRGKPADSVLETGGRIARSSHSRGDAVSRLGRYHAWCLSRSASPQPCRHDCSWIDAVGAAWSHAGDMPAVVWTLSARRSLFGGDTVHVPEIQVPRLQVTSEYDIDEPLAAENRRRIFDLVASERLLVAGGHLHMPGFAHLVRDGGSYRLVPERWSIVV